MHAFRYFVLNHVTKYFYRNSSSTPKNIPLVKVVSDKEGIRVFFTYFDHHFKLERPKDEKVEETLTRIKLKAELHHKKEIIRQYYSASGRSIQNDISKEIDVSLMQKDSVVDCNMPNIEAWSLASALNIGDIVYEVSYNPPTVKNLNLPEYILSGCAIRPNFFFECASLQESTFTWYRSTEANSINQLIDNDVIEENGKYWKKIHEGYIYFTCTEDVGCYLKVVCTPVQDGRRGLESSVESKTVVEVAPDKFPFEERQENTNCFCEDDSIRCLTYNVLAKMYVEENKFPYSSKKARDTYYRKQILLKELIGYKSDIICLQEVEDRVFERDLEPILNLKGYSGYYTKKGGHRYEGVATFFQTSKFRFKRKYDILLNRIVKEKHIYGELFSKVAGNLKDMNKLLSQKSVLQLLLLEHIHLPGYELLVANTHLYSNKDSPEVRLIQAAVCTAFIEHTVNRKNLQSPGIIFCGDFNSLPHSPTYNFLMSGKYECSANWNRSSDANGDTVLEHNLRLDSACGTPEYTNYTAEFKGCLDYIFYNKDILKVTDVVPMPRHEQVIAQKALPSEYFPSDHIALICTMQWKKS
ncbi:2' like protein [Argiope bruennichi]|uniref:2' like protein n=1 Tax=Argiope bruennichi TaxID=94029 RepID=A0A8T0ERR8_ARGBR|nr:2' like protein [Argiope bruennichi]